MAPHRLSNRGQWTNYIDLNNSNLEVTVKLTTPPGGDFGTGTKLGTVNLPLHSLFPAVTLKFADKVVTKSNNLYSYRALIERLLN